jgi:hypothetical protein
MHEVRRAFLPVTKRVFQNLHPDVELGVKILKQVLKRALIKMRVSIAAE